MKQKRVRLWALPSMRRTRALILIAVCFALGSVLGCLFSSCLKGEGSSALVSWLDSYLSMMKEEGVAPEWGGLVWRVVRLPLLVFAFRFTVLGVLLIPPLLGAKGFLLSFAVSSLVRCYGWKGVQAALLLFGIPEGIQVVVLFLLAVESWAAAERRETETRAKPEREGAGVYLLCVILLTLSVLGQRLLTGPMASGLAGILG